MAKANKKQAEQAEQVRTDVEGEAKVDTPTQATVQLTVADLQLMGRIIDLASRRGAFQAAELKQVGESYDKLSAFLAYVESVQPKEEGSDQVEGTAG